MRSTTYSFAILDFGIPALKVFGECFDLSKHTWHEFQLHSWVVVVDGVLADHKMHCLGVTIDCP